MKYNLLIIFIIFIFTIVIMGTNCSLDNYNYDEITDNKHAAVENVEKADGSYTLCQKNQVVAPGCGTFK